MIDSVATPAFRGGAGTRPRRLVDHLSALGVIAERSAFVGHGLREGGFRSLGRMIKPGAQLHDLSRAAILSPVFLPSLTGQPLWTDCYDDWSLAPDINPLHRLLALRGYRSLGAGDLRPQVLTVNSEYMAARLLPARSFVVPNGVEEELGGVESQGSPCRRLLIFGRFFRGRTDFALLRSVAVREEWDEVIIAGVESRDSQWVNDIVALAKAPVSAHRWIDPVDTLSIVGERTVALVPHVVNDYTLSQDLMKVYQFLASGVKVICPRLLWPKGLDDTYAFLPDHGVTFDGYLEEWIDSPCPSLEWRRDFAAKNSWAARATVIAGLIDNAA